MTTLKATVEQIEELLSKAEQPYWKVLLKGKAYMTSKEEVLGDLEEGMYIEADVNSKKVGSYTNYYFNGWKLADGSPSKAPRGEPIEEPPPKYRQQTTDSERARSMALSYAKDLATILKLEGDNTKLSEAVVAVAKRFTKYILTGE